MEKEKLEGVWVEFDNERLFLKTALVGGTIDGENPLPMAMYAGKMDIGVLGVSLVHSLRAVMRINQEYYGFDLFESMEFIEFCVREAAHQSKKFKGDDLVAVNDYNKLTPEEKSAFFDFQKDDR